MLFQAIVLRFLKKFITHCCNPFLCCLYSLITFRRIGATLRTGKRAELVSMPLDQIRLRLPLHWHLQDLFLLRTIGIVDRWTDYVARRTDYVAWWAHDVLGRLTDYVLGRRAEHIARWAHFALGVNRLGFVWLAALVEGPFVAGDIADAMVVVVVFLVIVNVDVVVFVI